MMRHLTRADYHEMPWANGRGKTIELLKALAPGGGMLWRLSMATVAEDGPFSSFPGIERNLTVIDGPGFDLVGGITLRADPLRPVAFAGDIPVRAARVTGIAVDFNVMTQRNLPRPKVVVVKAGQVDPAGSMLCLFALDPSIVSGRTLARHDLLVEAPLSIVEGGTVLAIQLFVSA